ncbi:hypothetical protein [Salibacter sp.]|uniref:hypothetical protein n=1 Tax=Salibacter sp. TaxID=2010995 RepID=UPI00286FDCF7|nr:hypothetical protein [Salibacter sp.]MDR9398243.1 hypothetical protein [Salibacter sp.]MDR9487453.1 hypothetical protein [Salibacter sp.]
MGRTLSVSVIIALLFVSCNMGGSENDNKISLLNGVEYHIQDNEKELARDETIINLHDSIFNNQKNFNWPLYKVLTDTSKSYKGFISIPVKIKRPMLADYIENDTNNRVVGHQNHDHYQSIFYKKGDGYIVTVLSEREDFFWTYSILSKDSANVAFLMNDTAFSKRIKYKEL